MFIVVSYDISHDRRRARLHRALKNFGMPVQYSVFECMLEPKAFSRLQAVVQQIIKLNDRVHYYHLCEPCKRQIMASGGVVTHAPATLVV
jgi:CRISPR-associated protein Cas2